MPAHFAPAKLNLFLAVTGRRPDGFHDLVSVAAPLDFGDTLEVEPRDAAAAGGRFVLECDDPAVPRDGTNLVLKAAELFAAATGWSGGALFRLTKRIPMGAGLGGGSSDGVTALRALDQLAGTRLDAARLTALAAAVGSDGPLFLHGGPVVMRGRGERVDALADDSSGAQRIRGRRVLVFKPAFGVATPWAYGRMVARPSSYLASTAAERRLAEWLADAGRPVEELLFNNMETEVFRKFLALPVLLDQLRREFGVAGRMSGSGSACFAFLPASADAGPLRNAIRAAWGASAFVQDARLA